MPTYTILPTQNDYQVWNNLFRPLPSSIIAPFQEDAPKTDQTTGIRPATYVHNNDMSAADKFVRGRA